MTKKILNYIQQNKIVFSILIITLFALLVRIIGINFGKPYLYHIDEWKLVNQAGKLLNIKEINKDVMFGLGTYPPFFTYVLAFLFGIYGISGLVLGIFPSMSSIVEYYKINPFAFHLIGRYASAFMGAATIPVYPLPAVPQMVSRLAGAMYSRPRW